MINTEQKALSINLNNDIYGTFAEIGAGQEVARYFFKVGGAAGTVAKTMSAYDMAVSDSIYGRGESGRYVCEERLQRMLNREFSLLENRLRQDRPSAQFFAFANTVAASSFKTKSTGHGWLGVRFQSKPNEPPSDVILHVQLLDNQNYLQQEALGIIGVDLVYACFHYIDESEKFISSLMADLSLNRIEIDIIKVKGPAFAKKDPRLLNLELIKYNFSQAIIFDESGKILQPSDALYKSHPLILRGSFRPPTHVNFDMIKSGLDAFKKDIPKDQLDNLLVLPEISMSKLLEPGGLENEDFLARVDLLSALGHKVMISNKNSFHDLNSYLMKFTSGNIGFVVGIYNLEALFDEENYKEDKYGALKLIGTLFSRQTKIYVYPAEKKGKGIFHSADANISNSLILLRQLLIEEKRIIDLTNYHPDHFNIWSRDVIKMIEDGNNNWQDMVPQLVADTVIEKNLFGHKNQPI